MIKHITSNTTFPYDPLSTITLKECLENADYEVKGNKEEIATALSEELKKYEYCDPNEK